MPGTVGIPEREFHSKSEGKRIAAQTDTPLCEICGKRLSVWVSPDDPPLLLCAHCARDLKEEK